VVPESWLINHHMKRSLSHTLMGVQIFMQLWCTFYISYSNGIHRSRGQTLRILWTSTYCIRLCRVYLILTLFQMISNFLISLLNHYWTSLPHRPDVSPFKRRQVISHHKYQIISQGHSQKLLCLIKFQSPHQFISLSSHLELGVKTWDLSYLLKQKTIFGH
jgi:hypothetical protein